jgi:SSS family solute:Na+ symporter
MIFNFELTINFIHIQGIMFIVEVAIMLLIGMIKPLKIPFVFEQNSKVDMTPWKYTLPVTVVLLSTMTFTYILFSPIGLASQNNIVSIWFWPMSISLIIICIILYYIALKYWNEKYEKLLKQQHKKNIYKKHIYEQEMDKEAYKSENLI